MGDPYEAFSREAERRGLTQDCIGYSYPPEGWHPLVWRLLDDLEAIPDWDPALVLQIKSKFGGLRFYMGRVPVEIKATVDARVGEAEDEASRTCERCGSSATKTQSGGVIRTQCAECLV